MTNCEWCKHELLKDEEPNAHMKVKLLCDDGRWKKCCFVKQDFKYIKHYSPNIQIWEATFRNETYILQVIE